MALISFLNGIYDALNQDKKCAGLFIDIKKAFDMVDHAILLQILYRAGFRGVTHQWFVSYLENRKQYVKINKTLSDNEILKVGVPQGSVLGPILFLIYINSCFDMKFNGKPVALADDMAFVYSADSVDNIVEQMNADLSMISEWFFYHKLLLSEKTKCMFFQLTGDPITGNAGVKYHYASCNNISCMENCVEIECVIEYKYLGIYLDHSLNWKFHVKQMGKYLNCLLRKFYILKRQCPPRILRTVYFSLVQSKLEYGIICYGGTFKNTLNPINVLQKHFLRLMCFKSRLSSSWPLFRSKEILPLRHLYVYKVLKMFYDRSGNRNFKILNNYNIRSNLKYLCELPRSKKEHFRRYYLYTGPLLYNQLPISLRCEENYTRFLKRVKEWLFDLRYPETLFIIVG